MQNRENHQRLSRYDTLLLEFKEKLIISVDLFIYKILNAFISFQAWY